MFPEGAGEDDEEEADSEDLCIWISTGTEAWIRWKAITKERAIIVFRPAAMALMFSAAGALGSGCGKSHARWRSGIAERGFV